MVQIWTKILHVNIIGRKKFIKNIKLINIFNTYILVIIIKIVNVHLLKIEYINDNIYS